MLNSTMESSDVDKPVPNLRLKTDLLNLESFDIVRDTLGLVRTEFPHTLYCIAGTQAEKASWNSIGIFKLSKISGKRRDLVPEKVDGDGSDMEDESDKSSDEEEVNEENGGPNPPVLQIRKISHEGCVNRIHAMTQSPHICVSWGDTGHVQILGFVLQWSPTKSDVFASCSVDGTIAIWDIRQGKNPVVPFKAHKADVNVISWNRLASCMLASGSDDGTFSIHDLRQVKEIYFLVRQLNGRSNT